jgi:hypothetical protein
MTSLTTALALRKAATLSLLGLLLPFGTILVAWAHLYFRIVLTPMPPGWTVTGFANLGLGAAFVLGVLSRGLSRRAVPVALGGAAGILVGAYRACVSDVTISTWQRVECGLVGAYAVWLWATFVVAWILAHVALSVSRSAVQHSGVSPDERRRPTRG